MSAANPLIDDCFLHDRDRLSHDDTLALFRERLSPIVSAQTLALDAATGRICARPFHAPHEVPRHTNAAVDGFAFAHKDLTDTRLPISQTIAAGMLGPPPLQPGTAARIFTGAPMPEGADSVAMQEDCNVEGNTIMVPARLKPGANCRQAGEDRKPGELVVQKGVMLRPPQIAALASIGAATVPVFKPLRVALLSSGNEIRKIGDNRHPLRVGEVWDANSPMLDALLKALPVEMVRQRHLDDSQDAVYKALFDASQDADLILSTGGASLGAEDHMLAALDALGHRHAWQIAVKPGRPMMFGHIRRRDGGSCVFVGLPGNPVAAFVCFVLYARQAILRLCGAEWQLPTRFQIPAAFGIAQKKPDRREFLRGWLEEAGGTIIAQRFPRDGSGLISSLSEATGLIEIAEETTSLQSGDAVSFIPLDQFY